MRRANRVFFACFVVISGLVIGAGSVIAKNALDCTTDKRVYRPGQLVQIECANNRDNFVVTGVTFLVTTADADLVYNPAVPAIAVAVPPGESVKHTWNQTFLNSPIGADGEQVPRGKYLVRVQNGGPARFRIGMLGHHPGCELDDDGLYVDATASMIVWLDLMPTFPAPDDRVHALIGAEFMNLSNDPVQVEINSVTVRRTENRDPLFVFLVEPPAGWDGILEPGESASGEWTKTDLLVAGTFECSANVVGILEVAVRPIGDDDEKYEGERDDDCDDKNLLQVTTEPTTLSCVF